MRLHVLRVQYIRAFICDVFLDAVGARHDVRRACLAIEKLGAGFPGQMGQFRLYPRPRTLRCTARINDVSAQAPLQVERALAPNSWVIAH